MSTHTRTTRKPDWNRLYECAAVQEGHFTTAQAAEAGYSPQLLAKYLGNQRVMRIRRGIYRLVHFPAGEHEDLVVLWLWTERAGVFSHETALALHGLSDVLPARAHMAVPAAWAERRLRVPQGVQLHFADVGDHDRAWVGAVPVTAVARTLLDCTAARLAPDLVRDALEAAVRRGLVMRGALPVVDAYLNEFFSSVRRKAGARLRTSARRVWKSG